MVTLVIENMNNTWKTKILTKRSRQSQKLDTKWRIFTRETSGWWTWRYWKKIRLHQSIMGSPFIPPWGETEAVFTAWKIARDKRGVESEPDLNGIDKTRIGSRTGSRTKIQNSKFKIENSKLFCWANYTRVTIVSCRTFYLIQVWYSFIPLISDNKIKLS